MKERECIYTCNVVHVKVRRRQCVFSFHHYMASGDEVRSPGLFSKHLYLLSLLASPSFLLCVCVFKKQIIAIQDFVVSSENRFSFDNGVTTSKQNHHLDVQYFISDLLTARVNHSSVYLSLHRMLTRICCQSKLISNGLGR